MQQQPIRIVLSVGRTRANYERVRTTFSVTEPVMVDPPAPAASVTDLPKDATKLGIFNGEDSDRPYAAAWIVRTERVFTALKYDTSPDHEALKMLLISNALPAHKASGQWFDSVQIHTTTALTTWEDVFKKVWHDNS